MNKSINEKDYALMESGVYVVPSIYTYISNNNNFWTEFINNTLTGIVITIIEKEERRKI